MTEREFIETVLRELAPYVSEKYADRAAIGVSTKRDVNDLLTEVDLEVQRRIISRIEQEFPGDAVVAEEENKDRNPAEGGSRCWLLDPIDGTQNFVRGLMPAFGISLAFARAGEVVAGGVALPMTEDLFLAEQSSGAYRNGVRLHASDVGEVCRARIEVDFGRQRCRHETLARCAPDVIVRAGQVRCHGAAVIGLISVATGDMEAYLHVGLNPYDFAAGIILVEEAGGETSRFDGCPIRLFEGRSSVLASNGAVHGELQALLASA